MSSDQVTSFKVAIIVPGLPLFSGPHDGDVARAVDMRRRGRTVREIAMALRMPRSTVGRMPSQKVERKSQAKNVGTVGTKPLVIS